MDKSLGRCKSRNDCFDKLLNLLSEIDPADLTILLQNSGQTSYSSSSVISDEILRRDR